MFIKVFCVITLSTLFIQAQTTDTDQAWRVYQEMKSTIMNSTLIGLKKLQDLHENNVLPSARKVIETIESDMTETYFYKQDKMDSIAKQARDKKINITECLYNNQERWLTVLQAQMDAADKISLQALQQVEVIISQVRKDIRGSVGPVLDNAAAIDSCLKEEQCLEKVVRKMETRMRTSMSDIDTMVDRVEDVVVPIFTYMYLGLINVSTTQALEGKYVLENVTACADNKKQA